ncbi:MULTISPECIES: hypothetical protein [Methylorubrum]|uniref:hypothetical protein n=1 Tax=Methylorubrum TaxID=2282523 RepID=UPI0020A120C3|nr:MULTISPECIES: hypothetical protein [Methylorubrum]MCP1550655.1 hypothetical protein [Methylorubrum zatmanii]MCP1552732.1 hypothetical protein [Methylorubrum extorquens]MCP1580958.1 hypothetical protein [Methylorubrum extorquens]
MNASVKPVGKERPIIMSGPIVRAILAGRKTQIRRVLKQQPDPLAPVGFIQSYEGSRTFDLHARPRFANGRFIGSDRMQIVTAPYAPGDRLWVRETWAAIGDLTHNDPGTRALAEGCFYRADDGTVEGEIPRWRSPIHMPRALSRLTLEVTEVRVERLQGISEADAVAEGIERSKEFPDRFLTPAGDYAVPVVAYQRLWNSIHGKDAWDANPWVAAISFRRLQADAVSSPAAEGERA